MWPRRVVEDNNVNQTIAVLRRGLGAKHIATVAGRGYQFVTPVQEIPPQHFDTAEESPAAVPPVAIAAATLSAAVEPRAPAAPRSFAYVWMTAAVAAIGVSGALLMRDPLQSREPGLGLGPIISVSPITTYPGEENTPSLSPDGTQVAFSWNGDADNDDIYVNQIGTGAHVRLTSSRRRGSLRRGRPTPGTSRSPAAGAARFDIAMIRPSAVRSRRSLRGSGIGFRARAFRSWLGRRTTASLVHDAARRRGGRAALRVHRLRLELAATSRSSRRRARGLRHVAGELRRLSILHSSDTAPASA